MTHEEHISMSYINHTSMPHINRMSMTHINYLSIPTNQCHISKAYKCQSHINSSFNDTSMPRIIAIYQWHINATFQCHITIQHMIHISMSHVNHIPMPHINILSMSILNRLTTTTVWYMTPSSNYFHDGYACNLAHVSFFPCCSGLTLYDVTRVFVLASFLLPIVT